jgi:hypothetical protein
LKSQSGIIIILILICDTSRLSSRYPNNIQGILPKAIMAKKTRRAAARRQSKNEPSSPPLDAINSESDSASDCPPLGAIRDAIPGCASIAEDTPPESPSEASQGRACTDEAPSEKAPSDEAPSAETPLEEAPSTETPSDEAPSDEVPSDETPSDEAPAEEMLLDEDNRPEIS